MKKEQKVMPKAKKRKNKIQISIAARRSFCFAMCLLMMYVNVCPAFATDATTAIIEKFDVFYQLVSSVIQAIGAVILVWGAFEFGNSMQQQEGGATTRALQRVGGGLVMLVAPAIATAMIG